jgi:hypothetical protein
MLLVSLNEFFIPQFNKNTYRKGVNMSQPPILRPAVRAMQLALSVS